MFKKYLEDIYSFREERGWGKFHTVKNMAISLSLEAAEVLEIFRWKESLSEEDIKELGEELSDVFYWFLLLVDYYNIDIEEVFFQKMAKNRSKYPIDKCYGKNEKYDKL